MTPSCNTLLFAVTYRIWSSMQQVTAAWWGLSGCSSLLITVRSCVWKPSRWPSHLSKEHSMLMFMKKSIGSWLKPPGIVQNGEKRSILRVMQWASLLDDTNSSDTSAMCLSAFIQRVYTGHKTENIKPARVSAYVVLLWFAALHSAYCNF